MPPTPSTPHSRHAAEELVLEGRLLLPEGAAGVRLVHGRLRITEGRIAAVLPAEGSPAPDLGGPDWFIAPGFVDAHTHLPQYGVIGADGMDLLTWLARVVFPAEAAWEDERHAADETERVARSLLSYGTTALAAYATSHAPGTAAALRVLAEHGLAGHVGMVLMDRGAPGELCVPTDRALREAARLNGQHAGRMAHAVTPRFALSCSPELLHGAGALARASGLAVQTHLSETRAECAEAIRLHDAPDYTTIYARAGLLTGRTLLGHAIHLSDAERATLAALGSIAAHCPQANVFLRAGAFDRARTLAAGVPVALGSDVGAGTDRSMVRVARAMLGVAKGREDCPPDQLPTAADAWAQITRVNARLLGLDDCGELRPGAWADLVVCRPDEGWTAAPDPLGYLLHAWDDRWIRGVWAAGVRRHTA